MAEEVLSGRTEGERFPKAQRLRTRQEFLRVQNRGKKVAVDPLLALALESPAGCTRLGITVSTKVGDAVTRVRLRRQLRELFRKRRDQLPARVDVVLIARNSANGAAFEDLARAFDTIAAKLRRMFP